MHKHVICLLALLAITQESSAQFPGETFEDRKRNYIEDQGKRWEAWFPNSMRQTVWAWLERPNIGENRKRISEEIGYLTSENCTDALQDWENCWWTGDHPSTVICSRILYQYYYKNKVISDADAQKLKDRLRGLAANPEGVWCAVANYHFRYLVGAYLYANIAENVGQVKYPNPDPEYHCPPSFQYNGRSYTGGKLYDAKTIYFDYLNLMLDDWLKNGTEEDMSPSEYYAAQLHSIAVLYDFSPSPVLKNKAKMFLDWLILNYSIGFSANHLAGGHGRHYRSYECSSQDSFPFSIFFNMAPDIIDSITRKIIFTEFYVTNYRIPQLIVDLVEAMNSPTSQEGDDYYRIVRGNVPALGGKNWYSSLPKASRYDYVTKNYNLGGANFGTGWELNIKSTDIPFKIFINGQPPAPDICSWRSPSNQAFTLGEYSYQHRNAIFFDGGGYLYQWLGKESWDEQNTESGWQFFREGKVAVAVRMANTSALEVCTIGVDYSSYEDFKTAIKTKAELTGSYFKTTKGVKISQGYVDYGPDFTQLPFDRLEVWEGRQGRNDEAKVVDWNNKVMTISKFGKKLMYDFNNWVYSENGSYTPPDYQPPTSPANLKVTP
jgi:hypothetical protein